MNQSIASDCYIMLNLPSNLACLLSIFSLGNIKLKLDLQQTVIVKFVLIYKLK